MKTIDIRLIFNMIILIAIIISFGGARVLASDEYIINDGKLYVKLNDSNDINDINDTCDIVTNKELGIEKTNSLFSRIFNYFSWKNDSDSKYFGYDLLKKEFEDLNLRNMDLRGVEISDFNLGNNNFINSLMSSSVTSRYIDIKLSKQSKICKSKESYLKFLSTLVLLDNNKFKQSEEEIEDGKLSFDRFVLNTINKCLFSKNPSSKEIAEIKKYYLDDEYKLATEINKMPALASASTDDSSNISPRMKIIVELYLRTHNPSELNSFLEQIKDENKHLYFKKEGFRKIAKNYEDYLLLMTPVKVNDLEDVSESYLENLSKYINETKESVLSENEVKRFTGDWGEKFGNVEYITTAGVKFISKKITKSDPRHKVLGDHAWIQMSLNIIWGETVKNEDGTDKLMYIKDAVNFCSKIQGCYLANEDNYNSLRKSMGDVAYVPQVFSDLDNKEFWMYITSRGGLLEMIFQGKTGLKEFVEHNSKKSVRCVCKI
ncbi:MAG: hypothetical protein HQK49_20430 [Oligoflexia bacterium]|nr:hypothetical protein [Oligoflexia bacterium]